MRICWLAIVVVVLLMPTCRASLGMPALEYRGKKMLTEKSTTDGRGQTFDIRGMSGITYCGGDSYIAVMDNSNKLVALNVTFDADGTIKDAHVVAGRSIADTRDFEGVAYTDPERHSVYLSDEFPLKPVAIYEYDLKSGAALQKIVLPAIFNTSRRNFGMEAIARRPDGQEMWTANEESLAADGPQSTPEAGSVVRLLRLRLDGKTYTPAEQYAYVTEPIHVGSAQPPNRSGLVDLVEMPDGALLALERSFGMGLPPFRTSIYQIDLAGATDISRAPFDTGVYGFAVGQDYKPVGKKLLLSSGTIGENLEGLCLGPELANGNRVLLGVVDDGGSTDSLSGNTLVSFEVLTASRSLLSPPLIATAAGLAVAIATVLAATIGRIRKNPSPAPEQSMAVESRT